MVDLDAGVAALNASAGQLIAMANDSAPRLVARGGGARRVEVRRFEDTEIGPMLVVHLIVDVCDAMGANLVNSMVERLAARCAELANGQAFLRILSNLADQRLIFATGRIPITLLDRPKMGFKMGFKMMSLHQALHGALEVPQQNLH